MKTHPQPSSHERRQLNRREADENLVQRDHELEAARRISETLFQHTEIEALIQAALRSALEEVGAEAGSVLLAHPDSQLLIFHYSIGEKPVPKGTAISWHQGIAGTVFQSGQAAIITDAKQAQAHFGGIDDTTGLVTRDMITLPLKRWKGNPIGVMNVLNKRRGTLNENDLALLTIISAFAALAIEQARLFEEAKMAEVVRLLGSIGHDLKNLLQPIVTGTWVLGEELDEMFADSSGPGTEKRRIGTAFGEELLSAVTSHLRDRIRGFSSERPAADPHAELRDLKLHVESGIGLLEAKIKDAMEVPALSGATTDSAENVCRDVLAMIRRSTQRIHDRVKDIADCVKGLSTAPEFRPCRLMDVVREVFETLDILAKENDISLVIEGLDRLPVIYGDERRLYNAFYNLVNNAIPEVPRGGFITVSGGVDPEHDAVTISVADTGGGMPPEVCERLFSARAVTTKRGGTGLGTKIVKDVVDAHQAQITVSSEIGRGTTFQIRLPIDPMRVRESRVP